MKFGLFNAYEIRARLIPSVVIALPVIAAGIPVMVEFDLDVLKNIGVAIVYLPVLYLLSLIIRKRGKNLEKKLLKKWGGFPSSKVLLPDNKILTTDQKVQVRNRLSTEFNIQIDTNMINNFAIVEKTQSAYDQIRQILRAEDPDGLWFVQNAEYGALRNITAGLWLSAIASLFLTLGSGLAWWQTKGMVWLISSMIFFLYAAGAIIHRYLFSPDLLSESAERYAQSAWLCYLNIKDDQK